MKTRLDKSIDKLIETKVLNDLSKDQTITIKLLKEKENLISVYYDTLNNPNLLMSFENLKSLNEFINKFTIRVERLILLMKPHIYCFPETKGGIIYHRTSGFWVNDKGIKVKNICRSYGQVDGDFSLVIDKNTKKKNVSIVHEKDINKIMSFFTTLDLIEIYYKLYKNY